MADGEYDIERYDSDVENYEKVAEESPRKGHNLMERKRRDKIKDSFCELRDVLPRFRKRKVRTRKGHNLIERKRRDKIKDGFCELRDVLPRFRKKRKVQVSRVEILKETQNFIKKNKISLEEYKKETESLDEENRLLENAIEELDEAIANNDVEAIAKFQSMQASLKFRRYLLEDTDSEDGEGSDEDGEGSGEDSDEDGEGSGEDSDEDGEGSGEDGEASGEDSDEDGEGSGEDGEGSPHPTPVAVSPRRKAKRIKH